MPDRDVSRDQPQALACAVVDDGQYPEATAIGQLIRRSPVTNGRWVQRGPSSVPAFQWLACGRHGDLFLLSERQMARISPYFPLSHGVPRVDDRRVVTGIVYVIRNGLQWKDAPAGYGPRKSLYNPSFARVGLACSTASLPALPAKGRSPSGS